MLGRSIKCEKQKEKKSNCQAERKREQKRTELMEWNGKKLQQNVVCVTMDNETKEEQPFDVP